jgi:hypothetical protein
MKKKINLFLAAVFLIFWFGVIDLSAGGHGDDGFTIYEVSHGDSAWKIARSFTDGNADLLAESIIKHNDLNSVSILRPGMLLEIPE